MFEWQHQDQDDSALIWSDEMVVEAAEIQETWEIHCAWCLQEQGLPPGSGSHGICAFHRQQVWQQYQSVR